MRPSAVAISVAAGTSETMRHDFISKSKCRELSSSRRTKKGRTRCRASPFIPAISGLPDERKKLFAYNLAVFDGVHANLRQLHSFLRILVRYVDIVLNHESIVCHERSANFRAVHLHVLQPPIGLPANAVYATRLGRAAAHRARL